MAILPAYVCPYCSEGLADQGQLKTHLAGLHQAEEAASPARQPEQQFVKGIATSSFGHGGSAARVETRGGKVLRIRPLHYEEKYTPQELGQWKVEAKGKVFQSLLKTIPNPPGITYKKRIYSPNRIKYPLQRVDWDPRGARNPQNRGRSKYKRISWDEATDLIAGEIKRVKAQYGGTAILLQGDGHGESKIVHAAHGCQTRLFDCLSKGEEKADYTLQVRTPDSWEGWRWGATHMWGMEPLGTFGPRLNVFRDIAEHSEMLFFWGCDWETTSRQNCGQESTLWARFYKDLGIKMVFVCPDLNYTAAVFADKWIPVFPNSDGALLLAIAYLWIIEESYDKPYLAAHTHAFDKFKDYVLGKEDGIPKTPKWASPLCGVPVWTIKALSREWASKTTAFAATTSGGICRGSYSTEPTRLQVACSAMQGLGKPGTHRCGDRFIPRAAVSLNPYSAYQGLAERKTATLRGYPRQFIPKTRICDAILDHGKDHPLRFFGTGSPLIPSKNQFEEYQYPAEGCAEIHLIWTDTPSWQPCWNEGNRIDRAFTSPKIETIIAQHPWLENDMLYADIILPTCTKFEVQDIMIGTDQFCLSVYPEGQCIEPIGESKSDWEAVGEVARKLGVYEEFSGGKSVDEWMKIGYEKSGIKDLISWEQLKEKGFYCVKPAQGWENDPVGISRFYQDPETFPLTTPTGKIEFESVYLARHFPEDRERPPVPHWIPFGQTHQESRLHPRAQKYPLLIVSNHGRWRTHSNFDDVSWCREVETCKVRGRDGYLYEPLWINPLDASRRKIEHGDIVSIFNERGIVLGGAYVTDRIMPEVVYMDHGARLDPVIPGKVDRGGCINLITPGPTTSPNTQGQVASGFLVEVQKVSQEQMDEWKDSYPAAFERPYDSACGLRFDGWVEGGSKA
jgi:molybdopterin guanine dinucleotide-containing S/N-oxide reductase-like protein